MDFACVISKIRATCSIYIYYHGNSSPQYLLCTNKIIIQLRTQPTYLVMCAARIAKTAIKIPQRIERGPTDILKALASTVKYVPTNPGPNLQDDPYLLPIRPFERKLYEASYISGIKTARYLFDKHPDLFFRDDAEPKIDAYTSPEQFDEGMDFEVADLKWCIENDDVVNGIIAYKGLVGKNTEIDDETLLQFLELICYSNEEKVIDKLDIERSKILSSRESDLTNFTWKKNGMASKIFNQIKDSIDPPRCYSIMIAALSKFNEHTTAFQVFEDFKNNHEGKALYNEAYNALITSIPRLNSSSESTEQAIQSVVGHMSKNLVKPDVRIFNSIIKCYLINQVTEESIQKVFRLLNDMKNLEIDLCLTTINYVISIICKYRSGRSNHADLIPQLLTYARSDKLVYQLADPRDNSFLRSVMRDISFKLNNIKYAHQVHQIYMKNPNLVMNELDRKNYLDDYFRLIITMDNIDNIMDFYDTYRALDYEPSPDVYDALGEALDLYQASEDIIKKIYDDIALFQLAEKVNSPTFKKYTDKKRLDELPKI